MKVCLLWIEKEAKADKIEKGEMEEMGMNKE
jgi:hypothetical protein